MGSEMCIRDRFNEKQNPEKLEKFLRSHFDSVHKDYKVEFTCNANPFITKPGKLINYISEAIKLKTNSSIDLSTTGGTSDARFISLYCPVIEFGLVGKTMHQVNEHALIKDLKLLTEIYYEFLNKTFIEVTK